MNTPLLPASAAALCAALLLLLVRHLFTRPIPTSDVKDIPRSDVEKGETLPPPSYVSDIKVGADVVNDVWPPVEPESDEPAPTIGSVLPDVALVWGLDYSFEPRTPMSAVDRRPLTAYSHIASALGVDEPEPMRSQPASDALNASTATDTRPMRSRSLVSGIVSDWNSLSQSEQQAWATLSEAKTRRSSNSRTHGFNS